MTDHDETREEWNDVHALSGAYAVDALDDLERVRFEAHLRGCSECRVEVDSLREAGAALGSVETTEPPSSLRASVLAGIESIRPLPPIVEPHPATPPAPPSPAPGSEDEPLPAARRLRPWLSSGGPLLVAAALVVAALVTTVWQRPWADDEVAVAPTAAERVLTAPDAQEFVQDLPDGSRATVVVSRSEGRAVIQTEDMALAPDGKDYELWLQTPKGTMVPAGLMPDDPDATVLLDGDASEATGVGITVEPDGGSPEPTLPPVAYIDLSA